MKLLLDEHYADAIAAQLRNAGHDAVTVSERQLKGADDESLLTFAAAEGRVLLTNNARDFLVLVARWSASGVDHGGLLLTSDSSMPRGKDSIGRYVECLRNVMDAHPATHALANEVRWLP